MALHYYPELQFKGMLSSDLKGHQASMWCTNIHLGKTPTCIKLNKSLKKVLCTNHRGRRSRGEMGSWLFRKGTPGIGNSTCKATIEHEELNIYISSCVKRSVLAEVEGSSRPRHTFHCAALWCWDALYLSGPAQPLQLKHVMSSWGWSAEGQKAMNWQNPSKLWLESLVSFSHSIPLSFINT